jgi:hypothetical protein
MKFILKFFFILILFFAVLNFPIPAFAQNATSEAKFINVSYDLPFPGILPDNPLYFLKALRDNLMKYLIADPLKKAEYDLLMADKRLVSAESLVDKGNYQLAITTLSKSGNYFDEAIQLAAKAKREKENPSDILNRLFIASQKHQLVIYQMSQKTKGEVKYSLELLQVRVKNFQDTVDVVRSQ